MELAERVEGEPRKPNYRGRLSFALGALATGFMFLVFLVAGFLGRHRVSPGSFLSELIGAVFLLCFCVALVGEGIGIAGYLQRDRSRGWPVVGMVLNGVVIAGFAVCLFIGLLMRALR